MNRNVLSCPAPIGDPARVRMMADCEAVAAHLAPKAGKQAYHEIWLNGEPAKFTDDAAVDEPIYGKTYLPRKFKVAFGLPHDNCTDVLAQLPRLPGDHRGRASWSVTTCTPAAGRGRRTATPTPIR